MLPKARQDRLLVQEVGDELVVYDQERDHAHCLNRTAALVWRLCDGQTSVAELTGMLQKELKIPVNEELIEMALDRLGKAKLLQPRLTRPADAVAISRRQMIRKLGLAGALTLALPVITTLIAPTPAQAASALPVIAPTLAQAAFGTESCFVENCTLINCTGNCVHNGTNGRCTLRQIFGRNQC